MSCVLRAAGKNFKVDDFLKNTKLKVCAVYRKGEPKFKSKPKGKKNIRSGINIDVSNADFDNLKKQIRDAIKFLKNNKNEIKRLIKCLGQDGEPELDFGIEWRDVPAQSDRFPAELIALCGKLGLALVLSQYPPCDDEDKRS